MRFRALTFCALPFLLLAAPRLRAGTHDQVVIPAVKTSIYIGSVTLTPGVLQREGTTYRAPYTAKVFPYFFYNEEGQLSIEFSEEQLTQLGRGERVTFKGVAKNKDGEDRRIEGHATPNAAGANEGKIKVSIFVTPKIELIFNSTYQFKEE